MRIKLKSKRLILNYSPRGAKSKLIRLAIAAVAMLYRDRFYCVGMNSHLLYIYASSMIVVDVDSNVFTCRLHLLVATLHF